MCLAQGVVRGWLELFVQGDRRSWSIEVNVGVGCQRWSDIWMNIEGGFRHKMVVKGGWSEYMPLEFVIKGGNKNSILVMKV